MKKIILLMVLLCNIIVANAQRNDTVLYVENIENGSEFIFCKNHTSALVYPQPECESFYWEGSPFGWSNANPLILDPDVATFFSVTYIGCDLQTHFAVIFGESSVPGPTLKTLWKRQNYTETLEAVGIDSLNWFNYQWNTGETTGSIDVTAPGTYTCEISDLCDAVTRTFIVRDNVEIYRATCDLRSNLNQVTWLTTPAQAEYISAVNIYRNTYQLIATVPYLDGSFTDDIGSESTQWQYHVVAVDNDGNECPIPSYWKRTIHLDHVQGTQGEILQWTPYEEENPAKNIVIYYSIYDVVNGEPQHVMDVGNFTNVYAYNPNDFDGYGTVAAVFEGKKGIEELAFSNLTSEVLDVGENSLSSFNIYPNPSNGRITIRGTGMLTISNMIGQIIFQQEIDGESFVELPAGVYVAKLGNSNQKVVVE